MSLFCPCRDSVASASFSAVQGPSVAHLYVRHGTFVLDVLASVPLVVLPFVGADKSAIVVVLGLRILRLVRVSKIINMLFYIQMISVSGASGWRMIMGNIVSTLYTIFVMINFCACLWYYVGTIGEEGVEGWLAQEYSTLLATTDTSMRIASGPVTECVNCNSSLQIILSAYASMVGARHELLLFWHFFHTNVCCVTCW